MNAVIKSLKTGNASGEEGRGGRPPPQIKAQNFHILKLIYVIVKCLGSITPALEVFQSQILGDQFCFLYVMKQKIRFTKAFHLKLFRRNRQNEECVNRTDS